MHREPGVAGAAAAAIRSATVWSASMVSTRIRGVITSAAVRPEKTSVLARKLAVPASSVPIAAERRTSDASSAGVRAPESSSLASSPKRFRTLLEKPFSTARWRLEDGGEDQLGPATALPICQRQRNGHVLGHQFAQQHGQQGGDHHGDHQRRRAARPPPASPSAASGGRSSAADGGFHQKPVSSVVMVMPSWQLESWVERDLRHLQQRHRAACRRCPWRAARWTGRGPPGRIQRRRRSRCRGSAGGRRPSRIHSIQRAAVRGNARRSARRRVVSRSRAIVEGSTGCAAREE